MHGKRDNFPAEQFVNKVIRNKDFLPGHIRLIELIERGLFELESEGMLRILPRYPEIIQDMKLIDLSGKADLETAENDRRICIDLLEWMAEKWWS